MYSYFKLYENYYDHLINSENIVPLSEDLSLICSSYKNSVKNSFEAIKNSAWFEKGKMVVTNQIFLSFDKQLEELSDFISNNLVNACNLSINSLLPKLQFLKDEDIKLNDSNNFLTELQNNYNSLKDSCPSLKIIDKVTNTLIDNPNYYEWKVKINELATNINNVQTKIKELIITLEKICEECNQIIKTILTLNGDMSEIEIKSLLPKYSTTPISFIDINSELGMFISNAETILTIDQIIADSKSEYPLFPFIIDEKNIEYAKDGGVRFSGVYKKNDERLECIFLLPPAITKNNENIFAFYTGSGGMDGGQNLNRLNEHTHDTNPPYPMIIISRRSDNGGMVNEDLQSEVQIDLTTSALDDFRNYFGGNDAKIHAIGHSIGGIELNQIVADKPDFLESATFINGRMRFLELPSGNIERESRIHSYENTSTKLNAFIATDDQNVKLGVQLDSYVDSVDININCNTIQYDTNVKKVKFGKNNSLRDYHDILFDQIKSGLPDKISSEVKEKYAGIVNKTSPNSANMNIYFIEGASHTGFLPSCFPNQKFYDLILNGTV